MLSYRHRCVLFAGTAVVLPSIGHAQVAGPASSMSASQGLAPQEGGGQVGAAADPSDALGDIIVTAEKRSTTVQRSPAAITAVSGDELVKLGIQDLQRAQSIAPSVKLGQEGTSTQAFIRGVGIPLDTANITPQVAINFNGAYIPREATGGANIFDVERVEVLPGPQGTLYGRSATGGVINVNFRQPGKTFGGDATAEIGNNDFYHLSAALNLPASETVGFRIAANYNSRGGYMRSGAGDEKDFGVRLSTLIEPTDRLSIFAWGSYISHRGSVPSAVNFPYLNPDDPYDDRQLPGLQPFGDVQKGDLHQDVYFAGGSIEYDLGGITLTYLPFYADVSAYNTPWLAGFTAINSYRIHQNSNELKLSSSGSGPLQFLGGLYQFNQTYKDYVLEFPFGRVYDQPLSKEYGVAGYAQLTYEVLPKLRLTAGGRYSTIKRRARANEFIAPGLPSRPYTFERRYNRLDWKLGVEFDIAPRSLLYAIAQTGFNPGTYNTNPSVPGLSLALAPTKLSSYTVGVKNRFANGKLQVNVEGFYYDYRDLLVSAQNLLTGQQQSYNAKKVEIYGVQVDTRFAPTPTTELYASAGFLHARNKDFIVPQVGGPALNLNGLAPPYAPDLTLNVGVSQTLPLARGADIVFRVDSHHESTAYAQFGHELGTELRDFWRTDASITFTPSSRNLSLTAWVQNIEDGALVSIAGSGGIPGPGARILGRPRTYGLRTTYNF